MEYLLLEDIKRHLIIEHDEDDAYIAQLGNAVEASMPKILGRPLEELTDENCQLPADLYCAMMLYIGELYNHREMTSSYKLYDTGAMKALVGHYVRYK